MQLSATDICESSDSSTKQSRQEIAREEVVAGDGTHGYRQLVQSPRFGFDAEVASASAAGAAQCGMGAEIGTLTK